MRGYGLVRAGAMRKLAEFVAHSRPEVLAVCEIGSGDARALATRFELHWMYRGRQALFWRSPFESQRVCDLYLPSRTPLRRAGFLRVDGVHAAVQSTFLATQFARSRDPRVFQLRFSRVQLRGAQPNAVLFACGSEAAMRYADLGFRAHERDKSSGQHVFVRGFEGVEIRSTLSTV